MPLRSADRRRGVLAPVRPRPNRAPWVTVNTPAEATLAAAVGPEALVLQGFEAGGHRGPFSDPDPQDFGLFALLRLVSSLLLIAAVDRFRWALRRAGIAAALTAGAGAARLGTAFMLCPEAATSPAHRAAIESDAPTDVTRAFTGRRTRGIVNRFMREHHKAAPRLLWAGHAHVRSRAISAAQLMEQFAAEMSAPRLT
ncbi:MAG: nitronate monooxygenase [Actinobacteria bacterium]|nr:nitronate monooxygenase [Actinomycetota bacterium]